MKSEAAELRTRQYLDRAAEKETKRTRSDPEEGHEQTAMSERMDDGCKNAPTQSASSSESAGTGVNDRKRKADAEHPEDVHEKPSTATKANTTLKAREVLEEHRARRQTENRLEGRGS